MHRNKLSLEILCGNFPGDKEPQRVKRRLGFDIKLLSACCKWHEVAVRLDMANVSCMSYEVA